MQSDRARIAVAALDEIYGFATDDLKKFNAMLDAGNTSLRAEKDMLEQIQGPLDKFTNDKITLNSLLDKGTISAEQYTSQLAKMNKELEKSTNHGDVYGPKYDPVKAGGPISQYGPVYDPVKAGGPDWGKQFGPVYDPSKAGGPDFGKQYGPTQGLSEEARLLQQIQGPMQKYMTDLAALDALMAKDAITTEQYAQHVIKLNAALDKSHPQIKDTQIGTQYGPVFDPSKAGAGSDGGSGVDSASLHSAAAMAGIGLSVGAAVAGLKELSSAIIDSNDHWVNFSNSVRKFTDATHSIDDVREQIRDISLEIRASSADTVALYDKVRNATIGMYLSTGTLTDATKTLGIEAKANNIPLDGMESTLKRLAFAMDNGKVSARDMRAMFSSMPEVLRMLADSWHLSDKQFEDLVESGKITGREIFMQLAAYLPQAQAVIANFGKEGADEFRGLVDAHGKLNFAAAETKTEYEKWIDTQHKNADAIDQTTLNVKRADDGLRDFLATTAKVVEMSEKMFSNGLTDRIAKFTAAIDAAKTKATVAGAQSNAATLGAAFGAVPDAVATQAQRDAAKAMEESKFAGDGFGKTILDLVDRSDTLHNKIDDLRAGMASGKLTTNEYTLAAKELAAAMKSSGEGVSEFDRIYRSLYDGLRKGQLEYAIGEKAAAAIFVNGLSTMQEYADMLDKIRKARDAAAIVRPFSGGVSDETRAYDLARQRDPDKSGGSTSYSTALGAGAQTPLGPSDIDLGGQDKIQAATAAHRVLEDALAQSRNATARYDEEVQKLNHSLIGLTPDAGEYQNALDSIRERYNDMKTPAETFALGVKDATDKLDAGIYSLDGYAKKLHELREAAGTGTAGDGLYDAFEAMRKQSTDNALALNVFNASISELQKGFDSLVSGKGSVEDWGASVASTFEKIIEQMLLTRAAMAALGALGFNVPGLGGGAAPSASSSDYNGPVDYSGGVSNGVGADGGGAAYDAAPWPSPGGGAGGSSTATPMQHVTHNHYFIYNDNGDKRALSSSSGMSHPNMQSLLDHVRGRQ